MKKIGWDALTLDALREARSKILNSRRSYQPSGALFGWAVREVRAIDDALERQCLTLREAANAADAAFDDACREHLGADRWAWFRACDAHAKGAATPEQAAMAQNQAVIAAHDASTKALHASYSARDGAKGFLGSRGA